MNDALKPLSPEEIKARDGRNRALALVLAALVVLFFLVTIVQLTLGDGIAERM